jgi:hypothetical protein
VPHYAEVIAGAGTATHVVATVGASAILAVASSGRRLGLTLTNPGLSGTGPIWVNCGATAAVGVGYPLPSGAVLSVDPFRGAVTAFAASVGAPPQLFGLDVRADT